MSSLLRPKTKVKLPPPPTGRKLPGGRPSLTIVAAEAPEEQFFNSGELYRPAGFGLRLVSTFLDTALMSLAATLLQKTLSFAAVAIGSNLTVLPFVLVAANLVLSYFIYWKPLMKTGQSYGKKLLKLKVVSSETVDDLTPKLLFKRELYGKLLSTISLGVGYLMAAGPKKQALHDRVFKTRVVILGR